MKRGIGPGSRFYTEDLKPRVWALMEEGLSNAALRERGFSHGLVDRVRKEFRQAKGITRRVERDETAAP